MPAFWFSSNLFSAEDIACHFVKCVTGNSLNNTALENKFNVLLPCSTPPDVITEVGYALCFS